MEFGVKKRRRLSGSGEPGGLEFRSRLDGFEGLGGVR